VHAGNSIAKDLMRFSLTQRKGEPIWVVLLKRKGESPRRSVALEDMQKTLQPQMIGDVVQANVLMSAFGKSQFSATSTGITVRSCNLLVQEIISYT